MDLVQSNWSSIMVHLVLCPRTKSSPSNPKVWSTWSNSRIQARIQIKDIDPPKVQVLWSFIRKISDGPGPVHLVLHYGPLGPMPVDQVQSTLS